MPKPFRPQILSGNLLHNGDIVYRGQDGGLTTDFRNAAIAHDAQTAQTWLAEAEANSEILISSYLIPVHLEGSFPEPFHYRDRIRILGPTFHTKSDLETQWQQAKERNFA